MTRTQAENPPQLRSKETDDRDPPSEGNITRRAVMSYLSVHANKRVSSKTILMSTTMVVMALGRPGLMLGSSTKPR
jgi:hypothetical protein